MKATTLAGLALLCAAASQAADDIKPLDVKVGLWESKVSTQMAGLPNMPAAQLPKEVLDKMPPEQRARMEAMMKNRVGGGTSPIVNKVCITRESLADGRAFSRRQENCTSKVLLSTPARQQVHIECNQQEMKMAGDLTVERIDSEHIKGSMAMKGGQPEHPVETKMSFENTWLSADCGNVKAATAK